jgi:hypothetical protein
MLKTLSKTIPLNQPFRLTVIPVAPGNVILPWSFNPMGDAKMTVIFDRFFIPTINELMSKNVIAACHSHEALSVRREAR